MSISIDSHEGGPIEGLFGSQVEQRVAHHVEHEDEPVHGARRVSEGRDSTYSSSEARLLSQSLSQQRITMGTPSPRPGSVSGSQKRTWFGLYWYPWQKQGPVHHRAQLHGSGTSRWWWWWWPSWNESRIYNRLPLGTMPTSTTGASAPISGSTGSVTGLIRAIHVYFSVLVAGVVSSKRRKSWFLSLILISLALTVFSGGYLLSQIQHPKDLAGNTGGELVDGEVDLQVDPGSGSGPRRDRSRGKKQKGSAKKGGPKGKGKGVPTVDTETEAQHVPLTTTSEADEAARMCNLEDTAKGQWVYSSTQDKAPELAQGQVQDMSWTGYGYQGCRSNIWNERYLLAPSPHADNSSTTFSVKSSDNKGLNYAQHLRNFLWQLDHDQSQGDIKNCRQPNLDVADFVEVLKRAPLVMIGDRFLEQEYLTIECMIMGMQDQLTRDYRLQNGIEIGNKDAEEKMVETLEYKIEAEAPPVVELKVAPGSPRSSSSSLGTGVGAETLRNRPAVYRKARPGQLRLIERVSNLTLITFIRSDVLWDSGMFKGQVSKHALKSASELSIMDAGGLHPDCKLVGTVLLCEPARIDHESDARGSGSKLVKQAAKHWWQWWVGTNEAGTGTSLQGQEAVEEDGDEEGEEGEMSFGSDLEHDMINLEWVQDLQEIVKDAAEHRAMASNRRDANEADAERKPVVIVSSGHFWEYDPQDALLTQEGSGSRKKLSKVEQDAIRLSQDRRRKLLRQRYAMVMTNMLDYLKTTYPDLRVMVQTSVRCNACEGTGGSKIERDAKGQEAALLNALTKTVVARMQDPLYSFLDTTFLRLFKDSVANRRHCSNFMMPGPLDTLVHHLYGELFRLDL